MIQDDVHSRSRLAGYKPEILSNSTVLIVGVGALGQNLALNLALAGVGEIIIVDADTFERHNATRSPLYPAEQEQARWGLEKAKVVAHKLLPMMTASVPKVYYAVTAIQALGDMPIVHANVVFAAVDNPSARAYLAERCHIAHRPLIEGGFHAEIFNLTIFGPDMNDPCYRCLFPEKVGAYSCTNYAIQVEQAQAIPAIQNTAAVLAGLQAEAGIQWLHNEYSMRNKRIHGNIRRLSTNVSGFIFSPDCPGVHEPNIYPTTIHLEIQEEEPFAHLLAAIEKEVGPAVVRFPEPFILRNFCTSCNRVTDAYVPEWQWLKTPRCTQCNGPFEPASAGQYIEGKREIHTGDRNEVTELSCKRVGFPAGMMVEVWPEQTSASFNQPDSCYLMQISGVMSQAMVELTKENTQNDVLVSL